MNRLPNYGCLLDDQATREDRIRDLERYTRCVAKIERNRCELEALRTRSQFMTDTTSEPYQALEALVQKIRNESEFEDIAI